MGASRTGPCALGEDAERVLLRDVIACWFPDSLDCVDGFHQSFDRARRPLGPPGVRTLVFQARMTWMAAQALRLYPDRSVLRRAARHGLDLLQTRFWDARHGGFRWSLNDTGPGRKHAYGIAFGIYAATAAAVALDDRSGLALAVEAFRWLERHGHQPGLLGCVEVFERDGTPVVRGHGRDAIGTPVGSRSLNTHLHLLEAYTDLYRAWPDPDLRTRLTEVLDIVCGPALVARGAYADVYDADWTPQLRRTERLRALWGSPPPQSHGHTLEAAYLISEAVAALGRSLDGPWEGVVRALADRALADGLDHRHGGFYDRGRPGQAGFNGTKIWWVQAEALNGLLTLERLDGGRNPAYGEALRSVWRFIQDHMLDPEHRGWFAMLTEDGRVMPAPKSDDWTDPYHQGRALMNLMRHPPRDARPPVPLHGRSP